MDPEPTRPLRSVPLLTYFFPYSPLSLLSPGCPVPHFHALLNRAFAGGNPHSPVTPGLFRLPDGFTSLITTALQGMLWLGWGADVPSTHHNLLILQTPLIAAPRTAVSGMVSASGSSLHRFGHCLPYGQMASWHPIPARLHTGDVWVAPQRSNASPYLSPAACPLASCGRSYSN